MRGVIGTRGRGGLGGVGRDPDGPAAAFEAAFARLQVRIETACAAEAEWQAGVVAGVRAALAFAAARPADAQALTNDALAEGSEGFARYDRMVAHFSRLLLPGREERPQGEHLPEITERMMIGGLAMLIAQRLDFGRHLELPALAQEAIQFVLTPYLGTEEARRAAGVES